MAIQERWAGSREEAAGRLGRRLWGWRVSGNVQTRGWRGALGTPGGWAPGSLGKKMDQRPGTLSLRSPWGVWAERSGSLLWASQVSRAHPRWLLRALPDLALPPAPSKVCRVATAALELLRRAVFQKARSAGRGPHGSLPVSGRSGPGPHLPCSGEQWAPRWESHKLVSAAVSPAPW